MLLKYPIPFIYIKYPTATIAITEKIINELGSPGKSIIKNPPYISKFLIIIYHNRKFFTINYA